MSYSGVKRRAAVMPLVNQARLLRQELTNAGEITRGTRREEPDKRRSHGV